MVFKITNFVFSYTNDHIFENALNFDLIVPIIDNHSESRENFSEIFLLLLVRLRC